ncbi:MAG: glycosyltransferase family 4 protein [Calditrichaeota bacterium]|nr:glycosyltransferase family 4 protein [Calditrichota bacterium]
MMADPKNILLLTINFPPNPSVGTKRVSKILKYIDQKRFCFSVLTLKTKYYDAELGKLMGNYHKIPASVKVYRTDKSDFTKYFTIIKQWFKRSNKRSVKNNSAEPYSHKQSSPKSKTDNKPNIVNRLTDKIRNFTFFFFEFPDKHIGWLPHAIVEGVRLIRVRNIDIIFTTAPPHSVFIIALILKKLTHKKLVLDFRDPWAISRWDRGNPVRYALERVLENLVVRSADLIFFVTEKMRDEYVNLYKKQNPEKFKVFYNGFDPEDFVVKGDRQDKKKKNEKAKRFVHLGTLYKRRNPQPLLIAVKELHEQGLISPDTLQIEFIGSVVKEVKFIFRKIEELGIRDYVRFTSHLSFDRSIAIMLQADVLLLIQPETDLQIPAKLFEYIYTKKPILAIAEENSATHQVIKQGKMGLFTPSKDVAAIKDAILKLLNNSVRFDPDTDYINQFNYKYYIKQFENYLDDI